jgi:hypothetical protein
MNKLDLLLPSDLPTLDQVSVSTSLPPVRRLVVLVPADSDHTSATRRITDLAKAQSATVLFLGLCKDGAQELGLRRQLVTLSALLQDAQVCAEARVENGTSWVDVVASILQAGDMLVCSAEQRVGFPQRPLSQVLESNLRMPVYILSGLYPEKHSRSNWSSQLMAWAGSFGIIVGAALLQIRITTLPQDWAQTTLLVLSVFGEVWLLWAWNSLFS